MRAPVAAPKAPAASTVPSVGPDSSDDGSSSVPDDLSGLDPLPEMLPERPAPAESPESPPPIAPAPQASLAPVTSKTGAAGPLVAKQALLDAIARDDRDAIPRLAQKLLSSAPESDTALQATALAALGRSELLAGRPRSAARPLARALELDSSNVPALFAEVAEALLDRNRELAVARAKALAALGRSPAAQTAHALLLALSRRTGHRAAHDRIERGEGYDPVLSKAVLNALRTP
jgi:hypothetical protein